MLFKREHLIEKKGERAVLLGQKVRGQERSQIESVSLERS